MLIHKIPHKHARLQSNPSTGISSELFRVPEFLSESDSQKSFRTTLRSSVYSVNLGRSNSLKGDNPPVPEPDVSLVE